MLASSVERKVYGLGFGSWQVQGSLLFSKMCRPSLGSLKLLLNMYRCSFPGIKRLGHGVDHSSSLSSEVSNERRYTCNPPTCFQAVEKYSLTLLTPKCIYFTKQINWHILMVTRWIMFNLTMSLPHHWLCSVGWHDGKWIMKWKFRVCGRERRKSNYFVTPEFAWTYRRKLRTLEVAEILAVIRTGYLRNKSQKLCRLGQLSLWMKTFEKIKLQNRSLRKCSVKESVINELNLHTNGIITWMAGFMACRTVNSCLLKFCAAMGLKG